MFHFFFFLFVIFLFFVGGFLLSFNIPTSVLMRQERKQKKCWVGRFLFSLLLFQLGCRCFSGSIKWLKKLTLFQWECYGKVPLHNHQIFKRLGFSKNFIKIVCLRMEAAKNKRVGISTLMRWMHFAFWAAFQLQKSQVSQWLLQLNLRDELFLR